MNDKILICGAGPSLTKNLKDLDRLGKFPGTILATDAAIKYMFEADIVPDHCACLEDLPAQAKYFTPDIVKERGGEIPGNGYISDRVAPTVRLAMSKAKINISIATKVRGATTSNVGLFSWLIGHLMLGATDTYLIGMDHCYAKDQPPPVDRSSELFYWGFYTLWNPHQKIEIILNPAHELWQEEFHWNMKQYPKVKVTNCTGWGALFGENIKWDPIATKKEW